MQTYFSAIVKNRVLKNQRFKKSQDFTVKIWKKEIVETVNDFW